MTNKIEKLKKEIEKESKSPMECSSGCKYILDSLKAKLQQRIEDEKEFQKKIDEVLNFPSSNYSIPESIDLFKEKIKEIFGVKK